MPLQFKFPVDWLKKKILESVTKWIQKSQDELLIEINRYSPVDTWTFQSQNRKLPVRVWNNEVIWVIENIWDYPERVERWFRNAPVNWHLDNGQIYNSVGANTYKRSLERKKANILKNIQW
jgi:hypothetical protein